MKKACSTILFLLLLFPLFDAPVCNSSEREEIITSRFHATYYGNQEYIKRLLLRSEIYWQYLQTLYRSRPSTPVYISFYDGRKHFIENIPHKSLPQHIDAVILYNRIHLVIEPRNPITNEMTLFHEMVHLFQHEFYQHNEHNVWWSDIQAEYLLWNYFAGSPYSTEQKIPLSFDPENIRRHSQAGDVSWRYNRSLGILVMDYLLDKYSLSKDNMGTLISYLMQDRLLHNQRQVIEGALKYLEKNQERYQVLDQDEEIPVLHMAPGSVPSSNTFSYRDGNFLFHLFRQISKEGEITFHDLALLKEDNDITILTRDMNYYDWPAWKGENSFYCVMRDEDEYLILHKKIEGDEPPQEIYRAPYYLSNLFYDVNTDSLIFAQDKGAARNLYMLQENGRIITLTEGPGQNWSPYLHGNYLYFLSSYPYESSVMGGDLYKLDLKEKKLKQLTEGLLITSLNHIEDDYMVMTVLHPQNRYPQPALFTISQADLSYPVETFFTNPLFSHLEKGQIRFWLQQ